MNPQLALHIEGDMRVDGNNIYNDPDATGPNLNYHFNWRSKCRTG